MSVRCDVIDDCAVNESAQSIAAACLNYCAFSEGCSERAERLTGARSRVLEETSTQHAMSSLMLVDRTSPLDTENLTCAEAEACLAPASTLCAEVCAEALDCSLPLAGSLAADCEAACLGGEISDEVLTCAASRSARGRLWWHRRLLRFPDPSPTPACEAYCDALKVCDPAVDLYTCHIDCIADSTGDALRADCTDVASCDDIARCQDEEAVSPIACLTTAKTSRWPAK